MTFLEVIHVESLCYLYRRTLQIDNCVKAFFIKLHN